MVTAARSRAGFTLTELVVSTAIFSIVSVGLLMGFTSLERSYTATTDFTVNHADQMRISDYLALDLRRAVAVNAATKDITIPIYYNLADKTPLLPALDGGGGVFYTATDMTGKTVRSGPTPPSAGLGVDGDYYVQIGTEPMVWVIYGPKAGGTWGTSTPLSLTIHYYLQGDTLYRQQGTDAPVALAVGVADFNVNIDDTDKKVVKTQISFDPTFRSGGTPIANVFYNTTLLRESRRDAVSSVY